MSSAIAVAAVAPLLSALAVPAAMALSSYEICLGIPGTESIKLCSESDDTTVIKNESSSVIVFDYGTASPQLLDRTEASMYDRAADAVVRSRCWRGVCTLAPGRSVKIFGYDAHVPLKLGVNLQQTLDVQTAEFLMGRLEAKFDEKRLGADGRLLAGVASCAAFIAGQPRTYSHWRTLGSWTQALKLAIKEQTGYAQCRSITKKALGKKGATVIDKESGAEAGAGKLALTWAKSLLGGAWIEDTAELIRTIGRR